MGLNQEVEPSVGEQSARLTTLPPSRRLSGFSRRTFLAGGLAAASSILGLRHSSAETSAETPVNPEQLLSDAVTNWSTLAVKEEALGELFELTGIQLSSGFTDQIGYSELFQSMLVTLDEQGNPILRNLLTEEEQNGFDTSNVPPFLGDAAPQKGVFTVEPSAQITQMTAALGRVLEFNAQITGAGRFGAGGYNSYRIGDETGDKIGLVEYYSGELPGIIRMAQFGHLAQLAGIVPEYFMLKPGELAQGGGTAVPSEIQPGPVFETLQTGKGKQTEWIIQKAPDSPITALVQRPDALAHVADTYLPKGGLKRVEIKFLPVFEGFKYQDMEFGPIVISLTNDAVYGPLVRIKRAIVTSGDTLTIYFSIVEDKGYESLELMRATAESQDKVDSNFAASIGDYIAEAGGYNRSQQGRVSPEAVALGRDNNLPPAIILVSS